MESPLSGGVGLGAAGAMNCEMAAWISNRLIRVSLFFVNGQELLLLEAMAFEL